MKRLSPWLPAGHAALTLGAFLADLATGGVWFTAGALGVALVVGFYEIGMAVGEAARRLLPGLVRSLLAFAQTAGYLSVGLLWIGVRFDGGEALRSLSFTALGLTCGCWGLGGLALWLLHRRQTARNEPLDWPARRLRYGPHAVLQLGLAVILSL